MIFFLFWSVHMSSLSQLTHKMRKANESRIISAAHKLVNGVVQAVHIPLCHDVTTGVISIGQPPLRETLPSLPGDNVLPLLMLGWGWLGWRAS